MSQLQSLLSQARIPIRDKGTNVGNMFINICCPYCDDELFHFGIHESELFFKCLVCGTGGGWHKLVSEKLSRQYPHVDWYSLNQSKYKTRYTDTKEYLPKEISDLTRPMLDTDHTEYQYLTEIPYDDELGDKHRPRGFEPSLIATVNPGVGLGKLAGYVTFTSGQNLIARNYCNNSKPRWFKSINDGVYIYGAEFVREVQPDWIAITEGVFDCLSVPYGHGLAILGSMSSIGWISKLVESIPVHTKSVLLLLDRGVPRSTLYKFELILQDCGLSVFHWNWGLEEFEGLKDIDECRLIYGREWVTTRCEQLVGRRSKEMQEVKTNFL